MTEDPKKTELLKIKEQARVLGISILLIALALAGVALVVTEILG